MDASVLDACRGVTPAAEGGDLTLEVGGLLAPPLSAWRQVAVTSGGFAAASTSAE